MNTVNITGRLAAQPELKTTPNGKSVCNFRLAVGRPKVKDITDWIPCTAWNQSAEYICKYAQKGNRVGVSGMLTSREYEDKDGNRRTSYEVLCEALEILESKAAPSASISSNETAKPSEKATESFAGMTGIELVEEDLPF